MLMKFLTCCLVSIKYACVPLASQSYRTTLVSRELSQHQLKGTQPVKTHLGVQSIENRFNEEHVGATVE